MPQPDDSPNENASAESMAGTIRGDTTLAHHLNTQRLCAYLAGLADSKRGLPATPSKPDKVCLRLVAEEAGIAIDAINDPKSALHRELMDRVKSLGFEVCGATIKVRMARQSG